MVLETSIQLASVAGVTGTAFPLDAARDFVETHGRQAADVMTRKVVTVEENTPVQEIAELLETPRDIFAQNEEPSLVGQIQYRV